MILPKKNLGQNFLIDERICNYIGEICASMGSELIEIGCGTGNLTRCILKQNKHIRLHGVEIDPRAEDSLIQIRNEFAEFSYEINNALQIKFTNKSICGNLPYNIGSKILLQAIQQGAKNFVFMLQREVVAKIAANVNTSEYSSISVLAQAFYNIKKGKIVSPGAFYPRPDVDSQIIIGTLSRDPKELFQPLSTILRIAFNNRRKMLRNTLCKEFDWIKLNEEKRPQEITVEEYFKTAEEYYAIRSCDKNHL